MVKCRLVKPISCILTCRPVSSCHHSRRSHDPPPRLDVPLVTLLACPFPGLVLPSRRDTRRKTAAASMTTTLASSILALATTVHVALMLLRKHRSFPDRAFPLFLLPSLAFSAQPWLLPTGAWVVATLVAHAVWFILCERLLPAPAPVASRPASPARALASAPPRDASVARPGGSAPARSTPPAGPLSLPVLAVIEETDSIRTFRLARPSGFEFQAGQFLSVRVMVDGRPLSRCYSISSAPATTGYLEISVRRQGKVSGVLHATLRPGSQLSINRPAGKFVYPADDERPLVLLAGGIGITPLLSMLRHGVATQPGRPITLLYSARAAADLAFADELFLLARRHRQVNLHLLTSREHPDPPLLHGRIDGPTLARLVATPAGAISMICGPQPMIDEVTATLLAMGVPAPQVRSEAFEPAAAAQEGAVHVTAPPPSGGERSRASQYRLTLTQSNVVVPVGARDTLLDAAEAGGADIPSSCRSGMCLTCRCRLLDGDVHCDSDALDDADRADGYILPCVSWARSDCALDV